MQCPNCSAAAPDGAPTCPNCGVSLGTQPTAPPPSFSKAADAPTVPPKTAGMATAAMIVGIAGILCPIGLTAIAGLVLSIIALGQIKRSEGRLAGHGLAITGVVCSSLGLVLVLIMGTAAVLFPVFSKARGKARVTQCLNNQKQLATATLMYSQDNNETLPWGDAWEADTKMDVGALHCPAVDRLAEGRRGTETGYGYNDRLSGVSLGAVDDPTTTVLVADSDTRIIGSTDDLALRHDDEACAAFLDGHVEARGNVSRWVLQPSAPGMAGKRAHDPVAKPSRAQVAAAKKAGTRKALITTVQGNMEVELYGAEAPLTVANFVGLAKAGFYDGLTFHRVETMKGFQLIQGGCPQGNGMGDPGYNIDLEISPTLRHEEGALAMARANDPNSAGSQFYICTCPIPQLDDNYAVFGKVTRGLATARRIEVGDQIIAVRIIE